MAKELEAQRKVLIARQDSEATLHWSRNSYFLVVMSILILAFGQAPVGNNLQLGLFRLLISILGAAISVVWILIQDRSSQYILYYKNKSRELAESTGAADVYPEHLRGFEMRKLAFALPSVFLIIWVAFLVLTLVNLWGLLIVLIYLSLTVANLWSLLIVSIYGVIIGALA
jgi:hypothetical protein